MANSSWIPFQEIMDTSPLSIKTLNDTLYAIIKKIQGNISTLDLDSSVTQEFNQVKTDYQTAIDNATSLITGTKGGNVLIHLDSNGEPYEILIMDTKDINTAQNIWRWDIGGFGYSSTGYNGPYSTAITMDGHIVASFITALTITGEQIIAGLIKGGKVNFDLDNGTFLIGNSDTDYLLYFDGTDLKINVKVALSQLTALGCNPRIDLFKDLTISNGGEPAIDASDGNGSPGNKIRFMWNRNNYIAVEENAIDFFFYYAALSGTSSVCQVRPDGFYVGGHKIGGVDSSTGQYNYTDDLGALIRLWVQPESPSNARTSDVWVDTDDYSRYDKTTLTADTTLNVSDNEVITANGTFTITLHDATKAGIIKKIYNIGTGIVTLAGTINGQTNMLLYPGESVELVTDGTGWRY